MIARKLFCYYTSKGIAYYRLRPIKVEVAYNNPRIVVFHDVIHDGEIATIKKLATPRVMFFVTRHLRLTSNERSLYSSSKELLCETKQLERTHRHTIASPKRLGWTTRSIVMSRRSVPFKEFKILLNLDLNFDDPMIKFSLKSHPEGFKHF